MDHAVAQALRNLLPFHNGDLPAELCELALALLAQSRSLVGSLRAEEEIARSYACAHLACSRYVTVNMALWLVLNYKS